MRRERRGKDGEGGWVFIIGFPMIIGFAFYSLVLGLRDDVHDCFHGFCSFPVCFFSCCIASDAFVPFLVSFLVFVDSCIVLHSFALWFTVHGIEER